MPSFFATRKSHAAPIAARAAAETSGPRFLRHSLEHYDRILEATDGVDLVTQDMVIEILRDVQGHRRLFEGFLREYEAGALAQR